MTKKSNKYGRGTGNPHPVDKFVGARIRTARGDIGVSQTKLAECLGITFQQIQKYERAANRVSASMLLEISKILDVPIEDFFPHKHVSKTDKLSKRIAELEGALLGIEKGVNNINKFTGALKRRGRVN